MKIAQIQFVSWDKVYYFEPGDLDLEVGNYVIVETQLGVEMGRISELKDLSPEEIKANSDKELAPVVRKATKEDLEVALKNKKEKAIIMTECKALINRYDLPMKLVDSYLSFDGTRLTFAFIANGRVDFRDLLKELIRKFKKNIRLQQIGIRDEIKINGDIGCCGKDLCCQTFYKDLGNVTSDLADLQQVSHRGADRLSGVCGRLKCCLTYENPMYQEFSALLPAIGTRVRTDSGRGVVIGHNILKKSVRVRLDEKDTIIDVPIKEKK